MQEQRLQEETFAEFPDVVAEYLSPAYSLSPVSQEV